MLVGYDKREEEIYADEELEEKVNEYIDYYFEDFMLEFWQSKPAWAIWELLNEETREQIIADARKTILEENFITKNV